MKNPSVSALLPPVAENKILIVRGGAIGDFILTLPVLSALREQFPSAHLAVLGYPRIAELARWGGLADDVRSLEDRAIARFFARNAELDEEWTRYLSQFAIVISYLFDPDGIFQENVARCTRAQFLAGPHRPEDTGGLHATDVLMQPLQRLAIFAEGAVPQLHAPPKGIRNGHPSNPEACDDLMNWVAGRRTLAMHPGSGSEKKNWPESHWRLLLAELVQAEDLQLLILGGEAEGDRLERLTKGFPAERFRLLRSRPLTEVATAIAGCDQFLGHDSGISHLAAAVGRPTTVLWGPSVETVWRPKGENVSILRHPEGLQRLDVMSVLRAIVPAGP